MTETEKAAARYAYVRDPERVASDPKLQAFLAQIEAASISYKLLLGDDLDAYIDGRIGL